MTARAFEAIVIGAGQAGPSLVGRLSAAGMNVALIERHLIGGTCVNTGCTPTKALVASAYAAHLAHRAGEYGVGIGGPVTVDLSAVKARKDRIVLRSRGNNETWLAGLPGCTLVRGHARFENATTVRVGEELLTAPRIFINVGGRALVPDLEGVESISYLTNTGVLELETVPEHLAVIGGSYIGLEFAQIFRRFGARVTVIEQRPHLVSREDPDVSAAIQAILEAEGIAIRTNAECIRFEPRADGIAVGVDCTAGPPEIMASHVLLAVGRRPNTDDLGLEAAGIETDERGYIRVDDALQTTAPSVWALGDCNGRGAFTHTAYNDYEIVAANLLDGGRRRVSDRILGYALFTDPPLGRVGMTETEARAAHANVRVGMRPMTRVGRAVEKGETQGFMKIIVDGASQMILGAAILGVGGDEAVHGVLDMMYAGLPFTRLRDAVPIHPTVSELIPTLLVELKP